MILLKYSEPQWLGFAFILFLILATAIGFIIEWSMVNKEDRRLMKIHWNRKKVPPVSAEGENKNS